MHTTVAAKVISRETHPIAGATFAVQLHMPRKCVKILVSTPPNVDLDFLQGQIEKQIGPDFSLEPYGCDSYLLATREQLSCKGLKQSYTFTCI